MKVLLNNNKEVEVEKIVYRNYKGKLMYLPVEYIKNIIDGNSIYKDDSEKRTLR